MLLFNIWFFFAWWIYQFSNALWLSYFIVCATACLIILIVMLLILLFSLIFGLFRRGGSYRLIVDRFFIVRCFLSIISDTVKIDINFLLKIFSNTQEFVPSTLLFLSLAFFLLLLFLLLVLVLILKSKHFIKAMLYVLFGNFLKRLNHKLHDALSLMFGVNLFLLFINQVVHYLLLNHPSQVLFKQFIHSYIKRLYQMSGIGRKLHGYNI